MPKIKMEWSEPLGDSSEIELVEALVRGYFVQDPSMVEVTLRPIARGRSGAIPIIAAPLALRAGKRTPLQPEFVKFVKDGREVQQFEDLAAGTALVFGQRLARSPSFDPLSGFTAFGFQLFEHGTEVSPLYAIAHTQTA